MDYPVRLFLRVVVGVGLLLNAFSANAATVETDGDTATAIRDLQIGDTTYDVVFVNLPSDTLYGFPPIFDFADVDDARVATETVAETLNAAGGVVTVGPSNSQGAPIFRAGYDTSGNGDERLTLVWEETKTGFVQDEWTGVPALGVLPFFEVASYADFVVVGGESTMADAGGPYTGGVSAAIIGHVPRKRRHSQAFT